MDVSLSDKRFFEMFIGKRVLASNLHNSKGTIPVYSGSVIRPFGYLDKTRLASFNRPCVIWGIDDALFDFGVMPSGRRFDITDHTGALRIVDDGIDPDYLLFTLKLMKSRLDFGWGFRASMTNMGKVVVSIPSLPDGTLDLARQKELASRQRTVLVARQEIESHLEEFSDTVIEIELPGQSELVTLSKLFHFPGANTGITKQFCLDNPGDIPVYASSKDENAVLGRIKNGLTGVKYFRDCLTWNRNGSVGYVFYRRGEFATNEDHRVMEVKSEFRGCLDLEFMRYALWNEIRTLGYGFSHKLGKSRMGEVRVRIPVNANGDYDLRAQTRMARRYREIYKVRDAMSNHLRELCEANVSALPVPTMA